MKPLIKVVLENNCLRAMPGALNKEAELLVQRTARNIETRAKLKIEDTDKSGRVYQRGKVTHQASAPGEPPATDTGFLVNSIMSDEEKPLCWAVSVGAEYGAYLEYGTSRMGPRPFFVPSFDEERDGFNKAVAMLIAKAKMRAR